MNIKEFFNANKDKIKRIGFVLTIVLMLVFMITTCIFGVNLKELNKQNVAKEGISTNDYDVSVDNSEYLELSVGKPYLATTTSGASCVSQQIMATVKPETAKNKKITWSVAWEKANSTNVADYITVTPETEDGNRAKINCFKAFTGDIIVTATTQESGFKSTCAVRFVGIPTDIAVTTALKPIAANTYGVAVNNTYTFDVKSSNIFNSVGNDYKNITATIKGVGSINVGKYGVSKRYHTGQWMPGGDKVISLDSVKNNFINMSLSNGKLTIKTLKAIESYHGTETDSADHTIWITNDKFKSYVDDCYFKITLRENKSHVEKDIIIKFDDSIVTGIQVSKTEVIF